jgi:hypothetical protein
MKDDKHPTIRSKLTALMNNDVRRLQHFSISAVIFFVGYGMIHWCEQNMPPSLEQELTTLALLFMTALAFLWAIAMQILYILSKTIK